MDERAAAAQPAHQPRLPHSQRGAALLRGAAAGEASKVTVARRSSLRLAHSAAAVQRRLCFVVVHCWHGCACCVLIVATFNVMFYF